MKSRLRGLFLIQIFLSTLFIISFFGQIIADNDAREYIPLPAGKSLVLVYLHQSSAHKLYQDNDLVSKDFNLTQNIGVFRPVHYTRLGPFIADPQVLIPFGNAQLDGAAVGNHNTLTRGIGDPIFASTIWLFNNDEKKTWFGITPFITVPLGNYEKKRSLNLGNNRWAFKLEAGLVQGFYKNFYFDLTVNCEWYMKNNDFFNSATGSLISQKMAPLAIIETHLSYDITKSWYISADYYFHTGGETSLDGKKQHDSQNSQSWQFTNGYQINDSYQLLLQYKSIFKTRNGPKLDRFGLRFLYMF